MPGVQHAPHIKVIAGIQIESQMREAFERPESQPGAAQRLRATRGISPRMGCRVRYCGFDGRNQTLGNARPAASK